MRGSIKTKNIYLLLTIFLLINSILSSVEGGSIWTLRSKDDFNSGEFSNTHIIEMYGTALLELNITGEWVEKFPITTPSGRKEHAMASIYSDDKIILFGGVDEISGLMVNDTWIYDLSDNQWYQQFPSDDPGPLKRHAMAGIFGDDKILLFGGFGGGNTTWIYDFSDNQWYNQNTLNAPTSRSNHAMATIDNTDKVVLFGGADNETWIYDLSDNQWYHKYPTNSPSFRYRHAMSSIGNDDKVLFFGGVDGAAQRKNDTWIYDLSDNQWYQQFPTISPSKRYGHAMASHSVKDKIILFGGMGSGVTTDIWVYDVSDNLWYKKSPKNNPPTPPVYHSMAAVYNNDKIVLFGGSTSAGIENYTWVYDFPDYSNNGYFISSSLDTGGLAYFGNIQWDASISPNTTVKMQLRTSDTEAKLNATQFVGPDGTINTYYSQSGQYINSIHNESKWLQFKAFFNTLTEDETPILRDITIEYNLIHNLSLISPIGDENWTGIHNITWNATGPDGDELRFDILLETNSSTISLAENLNADSWEWNTNTVPNGTYRIHVIAKDDNVSIPLSVNKTSDWFTIYHPKPNHVPKVTLLSPEDNAIIYNSSVQLKWSGEDDDNDTLKYYVLVDDVNGSKTISYQKETVYNLTGLENNKTYFWTIIPNDGIVNGSKPPIRTFQIQQNNPPIIGSIPRLSAYLGIEYIYDVNATDLDIGEILTYSLDLKPENMTINTSNGVITWIPSENQLGNNDVRVNVTDGKAFVTQSFVINVSRDGGIINNLPKIISKPIENAIVGSEYRYDVDATDADVLDDLSYSLDKSPSSMNVDPKTGLITWTPLVGDVGNHSILVKVTDGKDNITQTFTLRVTLPVGNHNPRITNEPPKKKIQINEEFRYEVKAADEDGDTLTFSLSQGPEGMIINSSTGLLVWTPNKEDLGDNQVTINVIDNKGGYAEKSFTIFVKKKAGPLPSVIDSNFSLLLMVIIIIIIVSMVLAITYIKTKQRAKAKIPVVIDDIFLIYKDGRLISHHTRKLKPDMDDEILGGMFTAVQEFIKTSFGGGEEDGEEGVIDEISYGKRKILIEHGKYLFIAAVVSDKKTKEMHKNMKAAVHNIEMEFDLVLEKWSGETKELRKAKKWVKMLIASENIQPITVAHGKRERLDQFNIETERKPEDDEINMSGKRT